MSDRYLGYGRQSLDRDDVEAVTKVLASDHLTQGPAVERFEQELAAFVGAAHAVAVSNGTAALHLACLAVGLGPGDAAIVPPLTFAATSNAVLYCGATPIFADVDPRTLCLSPESVEAALQLARAEGLRPRLLMPVHFAGLPASMDGLVRLARKHDLLILEDACHALGAEYRLTPEEPFRRVGSGLADISVWSFHPVKHITTGEGGAVTTNDPALAEKVARLRTHGITKATSSLRNRERAFDASGQVNRWYHEMQTLGFNYRLPDVNAALGAAQLKRIDAFVARRREIAAFYREELAGVPGIMLPPGDDELRRHSYHLFPLAIDFAALNTTRERFMGELHARGIGSQVHYIPVYWHPYYEDEASRWRRLPCPVAEETYERELSIPMFPAMDDDDCQRVVRALREVAAGDQSGPR
ncbi:MAG TPA: UDP-4-amino-4,6-dideoxy-N-acetyl-beta-L-altrosamine transaminase [Thermoanaerobaculia bacterium]|nr:UDP-4-amino-4,6-dideoxy-N-acetyl-beta-L-altrosamine transaminase [Thermoanaerobaculia bacterium]